MNPEKLIRETNENGILDRFEFLARPQGMDCRFFFGLTKATVADGLLCHFNKFVLVGKNLVQAL